MTHCSGFTKSMGLRWAGASVRVGKPNNNNSLSCLNGEFSALGAWDCRWGCRAPPSSTISSKPNHIFGRGPLAQKGKQGYPLIRGQSIQRIAVGLSDTMTYGDCLTFLNRNTLQNVFVESCTNSRGQLTYSNRTYSAPKN